MTSRRNRIANAARTASPICLIVPATITAVAAWTAIAVYSGIGAVVVAQLTAMGTAVTNLF
jgi:hypothetical protein